jgi:hypothetical protein
MTPPQISDAGWANYFARHDAKTTALRVKCPTCHQPIGIQCLDRWLQLTSLVHGARHQAAGTDPAVDAYAMHDDDPYRHRKEES